MKCSSRQWMSCSDGQCLTDIIYDTAMSYSDWCDV